MAEPIDFKSGKKWLSDKERCLSQLNDIREECNKGRRTNKDAKTTAHFKAKERF